VEGDQALPSYVKIVGADQMVTALERMRRLASTLDTLNATDTTSRSLILYA